MANSLLSKLRVLLSLVLLALAFLFLSLALARPTFENDERRDLLLLIDVSASMATEESGKSRLDLAIERARGIVRSLNGNQRAAIVTLGESLQFASNLTESPRELLESLERVTLFPGPLSDSVLSGLIDEESGNGQDQHRQHRHHAHRERDVADVVGQRERQTGSARALWRTGHRHGVVLRGRQSP